MQMDRSLRDRRDGGPSNSASSLWGRDRVHHLLHTRAAKTPEERASGPSRTAGEPSEVGHLCAAARSRPRCLREETGSDR